MNREHDAFRTFFEGADHKLPAHSPLPFRSAGVGLRGKLRLCLWRLWCLFFAFRKDLWLRNIKNGESVAIAQLGGSTGQLRCGTGHSSWGMKLFVLQQASDHEFAFQCLP